MSEENLDPGERGDRTENIVVQHGGGQWYVHSKVEGVNIVYNAEEQLPLRDIDLEAIAVTEPRHIDGADS